MNIYERIRELGYELPPAPPKGGIYKPVRQVGNMLYLSGQGATRDGKPVVFGRLGEECTIEKGQIQIKSVVKILVFVASAPGFHQQPKVADGASRFLMDIFGEDCGVGARSAIGASELPGDIPVEIEYIFEL